MLLEVHHFLCCILKCFLVEIEAKIPGEIWVQSLFICKCYLASLALYSRTAGCLKHPVSWFLFQPASTSELTFSEGSQWDPILTILNLTAGLSHKWKKLFFPLSIEVFTSEKDYVCKVYVCVYERSVAPVPAFILLVQ